MIRRLIIAAVLVAPFGAVSARQDRRPSVAVVLLDRSLKESTARLLSIGPSGVEVESAAGRSIVPPAQLAAVIGAAPGVARADVVPAVLLVDGRRLVGSIEAPEVEGMVSVRTAVAGVVTVPLDDVRSVRNGEPSGPAASASAGDRVILRNGDALTGFVESIGPEVVISEDRAKGGPPTRVPFDRVARVDLANPARPASGPTVWMRDGSVLGVTSFGEPRPGVIEFVAPVRGDDSVRASLAMDELRAVAFGGVVFTPLATLRPSGTELPPERRWSPPVTPDDPDSAPLGLADVNIPGPMTVTWDLPEGASRVSGTLALPRAAADLGDCTVTVSADGRALLEAHLDRASPSAPFNEALNGAARLRIEVRAGPSGPILDRVVIRRGAVLVGE